MGKADYVQADNSIDYTPVSAVTAGDVIVLGGRLVGVAKVDIAANKLGALAIEGLFDGAKDSSTFAAGDAVYWDADGNPVGGTAGSGAFTTTPDGNQFAGVCAAGAATGVANVRFNLASSSNGTIVAAPHTITLDRYRVWDARQTVLPGTAANDDLAIITGTFGSASPQIQSSDAKNTTVTQRAGFQVVLPNNYVAGSAVTIRVPAGMITTVANGTATVDIEAYEINRTSGAVGSDLCATAAQTINSLTAAAKDFTITPTNLVAGDILDCRVTIAITDSATATAVIGVINPIQVLANVAS